MITEMLLADVSILTDKVEELKAENKKIKETLEFYADKDNWSYYDIHSWSSGDSTPRSDTECLEGSGKVGSKSYGGKRARQCLKELEK